MLRFTTSGGTVHVVDVERGCRMRLPAPGRGEHFGDGAWRRFLLVTGLDVHGDHVDPAVGLRLFFADSMDSWFATSPVVSIEEVDG